MSVHSIVRLGHPALRTPAKPVDVDRLADEGFQELIDDMIETMRALSGVGIAAPQLGIPLQIFVYEVSPKAASRKQAREGEDEAGAAEDAAAREIPLHVVVNPMITAQPGELVYDWEGCLSIPDLRGLVPRHPAVRVRGLDRKGQRLNYSASGFEARIVQHEFDHLNGVVFLDRMRDLKALAYLDEWERYMGVGAEAPAPAPVG